jgi:hypothetical protein
VNTRLDMQLYACVVLVVVSLSQHHPRQTTAAIKAFQLSTGLVVDGIAGPKTKKQVTAPKFDNAKHGGDVQLKPLTQRNYLWELEEVPGYLDLAQVGLSAAMVDGSASHRTRAMT